MNKNINSVIAEIDNSEESYEQVRNQNVLA